MLTSDWRRQLIAPFSTILVLIYRTNNYCVYVKKWFGDLVSEYFRKYFLNSNSHSISISRLFQSEVDQHSPYFCSQRYFYSQSGICSNCIIDNMLTDYTLWQCNWQLTIVIKCRFNRWISELFIYRYIHCVKNNTNIKNNYGNNNFKQHDARCKYMCYKKQKNDIHTLFYWMTR